MFYDLDGPPDFMALSYLNLSNVIFQWKLSQAKFEVSCS